MKDLLKIFTKNEIIKTGSLLGGFGAFLVALLAILNFVTFDDIKAAEADVEKRARKKVFPNVLFSPQKVYIIEKSSSGAYEAFQNEIKPSNFDKLDEKPTIEFIVVPDKSQAKHFITNRHKLKTKPYIITQEQFVRLEEKLKQKRVKLISFHEAYHMKKDKNQKLVKNLDGWVVKYSAPGGYAGNIGMLIGYGTDNKITGYLMVKHNETPGLGVKANEEKFVSAFRGKNPSKMPLSKKDFGRDKYIGVDSISGATITSVAVSKAVKVSFEKLHVKGSKEVKLPKTPIKPPSVVNNKQKNTDPKINAKTPNNNVAIQPKKNNKTDNKGKTAIPLKANTPNNNKVVNNNGNNNKEKKSVVTAKKEPEEFKLKREEETIPVEPVSEKQQKAIDKLFGGSQ
ncbi:MAG: FMN-binding protein [Spirochaetota bacterium]|nr:FMN-binding protein [Spirochaetota bacterium]